MTYPSSLIALQMEPPSTNHTPHYVYPSTNHTNLLQLKLPPTSPNKKLTRSMSLQPTTVSITWVIYYPIGLQQGNDNHVRSQSADFLCLIAPSWCNWMPSIQLLRFRKTSVQYFLLQGSHNDFLFQFYMTYLCSPITLHMTYLTLHQSLFKWSHHPPFTFHMTYTYPSITLNMIVPFFHQSH